VIMAKQAPRLEVVEPSTAEAAARKKLREVIEHRTEITTRLDKIRTAQQKADGEKREASDTVFNVGAALEAVEKDESRYLVQRALGERDADEESPATKLKAQLQRAESELATKEKLVNALAEQAAELDQSLSSARSRLDEAVIEVLLAAPETKKLFESYRVARQTAVDLEAAIRALPFGSTVDFRNTIDRFWYAHSYEARADADAAWRSACAALRQNAGAELPSE
jgi:chromosome segregation ATPase